MDGCLGSCPSPDSVVVLSRFGPKCKWLRSYVLPVFSMTAVTWVESVSSYMGWIVSECLLSPPGLAFALSCCHMFGCLRISMQSVTAVKIDSEYRASNLILNRPTRHKTCLISSPGSVAYCLVLAVRNVMGPVKPIRNLLVPGYVLYSGVRSSPLWG